MKQISTVKKDNRTLQWRHWQARRNVFVSGGYKFVRTLYNVVVKVDCLKFWHKPHLWLGGYRGYKSWTWGIQCTPCPHSSDATGHWSIGGYRSYPKTVLCINDCNVLPRDAMLTRYVLGPCVRLSVRPSQAVVLSKRLQVSLINRSIDQSINRSFIRLNKKNQAGHKGCSTTLQVP